MLGTNSEISVTKTKAKMIHIMLKLLMMKDLE